MDEEKRFEPAEPLHDDENPLVPKRRPGPGRPKKNQLSKNPREWNFSLPIAARLFVTAYIVSGFDEFAAIRRLFASVGKSPESRSDYEIASLARRAMENERVQAEVAKALKEAGCGDERRVQYLTMLWEWFCGDDHDLKQTAARLLGKGFITEHIAVEKPERLNLVGLDEGLKQMGITASEQDDKNEKVN